MRKMRNYGLFMALVLTAFFTSCQKEISFETPPDPNNGNGGNGGGGGGNQTLEGNYKLVYQEVYEKASIEDNSTGIEVKYILEGIYTLKNIIDGTCKFTSNQFISTYGYTIDTTINAKLYMDGVLISNTDEPIQASVPVTTNTLTYVRNNADSLTFDAPPNVPNIPGSSGPPPIGPLGARISWSGDTLILKTKLDFSTTTTGPLDVKTVTTMKFKKV
jgi:hypothetical protein